MCVCVCVCVCVVVVVVVGMSRSTIYLESGHSLKLVFNTLHCDICLYFSQLRLDEMKSFELEGSMGMDVSTARFVRRNTKANQFLVLPTICGPTCSAAVKSRSQFNFGGTQLLSGPYPIASDFNDMCRSLTC